MGKRYIQMIRAPAVQVKSIRIVAVNSLFYKELQEIEKVTGLTSVNIRVLLSRARKRIREQFLEIKNYERL